MEIVVTGATGFVGRALIHRLHRDGHKALALVRDRERARSLLGPAVLLLDQSEVERRIAAGVDAVVHLAGAPIMARRWTSSYREELARSRIGLARDLVRAMASSERPPAVFVSASAVGIYGDRGEEQLVESSAQGHGFVAELCAGWEQAALRAKDAGIRTVALRIGVVLGQGGGVLKGLLPAARLGLAGSFGGGSHHFPWIHLDDVVESICFSLFNRDISGPVNCTAPAPVRNRGFSAALGERIGRRQVPIPAALARIALGQRADVVLASQRVFPRVLEQNGFQFKHQTIGAALDDILGLADACRIARTDRAPEQARYLTRRPPVYRLNYSQWIDAPVEQVFDFFSRAENLGAITPPEMAFRFAAPPPQVMAEGVAIEHRIRVAGVPIRWKTVIERWEPGRRFVDAQHRGPYRCWWHEHQFSAQDGGTLVEDNVYYAPPLGLLGRLANRLFIAGMLQRIFAYRAQAIRLRLGRVSRPHLSLVSAAAG